MRPRFIKSHIKATRDLMHVSLQVFKVPVFSEEIKNEAGEVTVPAELLRIDTHVQKKGDTYVSLERARKRLNRAEYFAERRRHAVV
jgi:hypothetical protein